MDKKMLLAVTLSLGVWLLWYAVFKPVPPPQTSAVDTSAPQETVSSTQPAARSQGRAAETTTTTTATGTRGGLQIQGGGNIAETDVSLKTDKYTVRLSNKGGAITSLVYNYKDRQIELVVPGKVLESNNLNATGIQDLNFYQNDNEFVNGNELNSALWNVEKDSDAKVRFSTVARNTQGTPIRIEKIYTFHKDKYFFNLEYRFTNRGNSTVSMPDNIFIASSPDFVGPTMDFNNSYNIISSIYHINGDFERGSQGGGLFSSAVDTVRERGTVKWVGLMSRYFLMVMVADSFNGSGVIHEGRSNHGYRTGMYVPVDPINPGESVSRSFKVYVGEKNKEKLTAVDTSLIDAADINWMIEPIRDFVLWALFKINLLVGNLGWALVIFSILTKILLLPLTIKSTDSMRKMQELNPKIKEIREKFKDKPEVMNKKVMELYKKEKVNPLSGCLPLLLQMPFFFALYSALINSIDLWNAPFIFWIQDLSMPDTIFQISGFNINILPIIMTITTFLQQKMTPGSDSSQQQMFIKLMPLIFIVIFWNMPSGLIIYWIMQNVLQVLHQVYINKKPAKEAVA